MDPVSTKKSATLMCGALLASIMVIPETATADPDQIFGVTSANGNFSVQSFVHQFLGPPTTYGLSAYPLVVSSALSDRPGFDFELTWDLTGFDTSFFAPDDMFWVELDIKDENTDTPIIAIGVKDWEGVEITDWIDLTGNGSGFTNGTIGLAFPFFHIQPTGSGHEFFTIQWAQVPTPGALALLGLAGVVGRRRRR